MGIAIDKIKELVGNRDNLVIFEVGCADGTDTKQFLSQFGTNLKIYTFDPDPTNIKAMSAEGGKDVKNVPNNKLRSDGRHTFTPVAIAESDGKTTFTRSRNTNAPGQGRTLVDILVQSMNQRLSLMVVQRETGGHSLSMMKRLKSPQGVLILSVLSIRLITLTSCGWMYRVLKSLCLLVPLR